MNAKIPMHTSTHPLARRAPILATTASLLLATCLFAQTQTPAPAAKNAPVAAIPQPGADTQEQLYSIKFEGGNMLDFSYVLREKFPNDNFVIDDSDRRLQMSGFELRNVRVAEIGRTVEFLTKGEYKVEIVDGPSGHIWRIGPVNKSALASSTKMRTVAAPSLFSSEKELTEILKAADEMRHIRFEMLGWRGDIRETWVKPLPSQKVFVIIGDEEGVAGVEGLIKAAEQRLSNEVAAKVAAYTANAPKIRTVPAPHLFAKKERWNRVAEELNTTSARLAEMDKALRADIGSDAAPTAWAKAEFREELQLFILIGTETGIACMESLIKAAEQLATDEDEFLKAERLKAEAIKAEEQATEKPAKQGKSE